MTAPHTGPLAGIRVLDLGTFVAGSFAAVLMGDLGAEVIKVEPPRGDPARGVPPFFNGESRFFIGLNRNKRGIVVDVRRPSGLEIVHQLAKRADVVTQNFRPGAAEKLGVGYDTLRKLNPRLIYSSSSGYGTKGPLASNPAFDGSLQALTGIATANQRTTGKQAHCAVLVVDFSTAFLSLGAITTALYHRERTGEGQKVELSLLQSAMTVMSPIYCEALDVDPEGTVGGYPYRLFETTDGAIFIGVAQTKFWQPLCEALGVPELGHNPRYQVHAERGHMAEELNEIIEPIFRSRSSAEWEERMSVAGVPSGPVRSAEDFFGHPQVEAMGMGARVEHSKAGPMRVCGPPFQFKGTPESVQRAAPCLGEHTEEVLHELGFDSGQIAALREDGAIAH